MQAELDRILANRARDGHDSSVIVAYWGLYHKIEGKRKGSVLRTYNEYFGTRWKEHSLIFLEKRLDILRKIEEECQVSLDIEADK